MFFSSLDYAFLMHLELQRNSWSYNLCVRIDWNRGKRCRVRHGHEKSKSLQFTNQWRNRELRSPELKLCETPIVRHGNLLSKMCCPFCHGYLYVYEGMGEKSEEKRNDGLFVRIICHDGMRHSSLPFCCCCCTDQKWWQCLCVCITHCLTRASFISHLSIIQWWFSQETFTFVIFALDSHHSDCILSLASLPQVVFMNVSWNVSWKASSPPLRLSNLFFAFYLFVQL